MSPFSPRRAVVPSWFTSLFALSLLAGCSGDLLKQPYPAKALFGLEPGTPDVSAAPAPPSPSGYIDRDVNVSASARPATDGVMLVRPVRVAVPYDGLAFVYRDGPAAYTTDYYANWVGQPSALFTGGLTDWLDKAGPLPVVATGSAVRPTLVLDGDVTKLLVDRTDRLRPKAQLTARFFLTRESPTGGTVVVADTTYAAELPVATDTPAGYAEAWGKAYRQLLTRLSADLRTAVAKG